MKPLRTSTSDRATGRDAAGPEASPNGGGVGDDAASRKPFAAPRLERHATLPELTAFGSLGDLWGW